MKSTIEDAVNAPTLAMLTELLVADGRKKRQRRPSNVLKSSYIQYVACLRVLLKHQREQHLKGKSSYKLLGEFTMLRSEVQWGWIFS